MKSVTKLDSTELIFVLIGASAVGKSTIAAQLHDEGVIEITPTWATRKPRPGESESERDRYLVSDKEFDELAAGGRFIDKREFYSAHYGVPAPVKPEKGREALIVLKPVFMPVFLEHYPNARVYLIDTSPGILPLRMQARGQSSTDIDDRMAQHEVEVADSQRYAHASFNNDGLLEETLKHVKLQIQADRKAFTQRLAKDKQTGLAS
jgi:guanylate kinase